MDKMPSPWSIEFRETNTTAKIGPDEIEHRGNKNSGRYKRGSKNNQQTSAQKKEAKNIRKNAKKIKRTWKKAYRGNNVRQAKKSAKAMRDAGLINNRTKRATIKKAKIDQKQLKRFKPQMKQLKVIIKTSRTSLADAKKMYNDPAIKTVETLYLTKPKKIDIAQADAEAGNTVADLYGSMTEDQKTVTMFIASMIADSEDEDDSGEDDVEQADGGGELDSVYETMSDEQKAVIVHVSALMIGLRDDEKEGD